MACQIVDTDDIAITTATLQANEYADRISALEARINKQDKDIIALRSLLMGLGLARLTLQPNSHRPEPIQVQGPIPETSSA